MILYQDLIILAQIFGLNFSSHCTSSKYIFNALSILVCNWLTCFAGETFQLVNPLTFEPANCAHQHFIPLNNIGSVDLA